MDTDSMTTTCTADACDTSQTTRPQRHWPRSARVQKFLPPSEHALHQPCTGNCVCAPVCTDHALHAHALQLPRTLPTWLTAQRLLSYLHAHTTRQSCPQGPPALVHPIPAASPLRPAARVLDHCGGPDLLVHAQLGELALSVSVQPLDCRAHTGAEVLPTFKPCGHRLEDPVPKHGPCILDRVQVLRTAWIARDQVDRQLGQHCQWLCAM